MSLLAFILIGAFALLAVVDFILRNLLHAIFEIQVVVFLILVAICGGLS